MKMVPKLGKSSKGARNNGSNKQKLSVKSQEEGEDKTVDDKSVLRQPMDIGIRGVQGLIDALSGGTKEFQDLLLKECSLIYECKICCNLFRSIANFISHKRVYCMASYNYFTHTYSEVDQQIKILKTPDVIVIPEIAPLKEEDNNWAVSDKSANSMYNPLSDETKIKEEIKVSRVKITQKPTLAKIVEDLNLKGGKETVHTSEDVSKSKYYSDIAERVMMRRNAVQKEIIELELINENSTSVFQTMKTNKEDNIDSMKLQVVELNKVMSKRQAVLQKSGKFSVSFVDAKLREPGNAGGHACSFCSSKFLTSKTLSKHLKVHHRERICYPCPLCKVFFATPCSVYRHLSKGHHRTEQQIRRLRPQVLSKATKRKLHIAEKSNPDLSGDRRRLEDEKEKWMNNFEGSLRCGSCGKLFNRRAVLNVHMTSCKEKAAVKIVSNASSTVSKPSATKVVPPVQRPPTPVSQPAPAVSQPAPSVSHPTPSVLQSGASASQPPPPSSQPPPPLSQPSPPVLQPPSPVSQPALPVSQPALPGSQPALPVSQPALSVSQPAPLKSQPVPLQNQPNENGSESSEQNQPSQKRNKLYDHDIARFKAVRFSSSSPNLQPVPSQNQSKSGILVRKDYCKKETSNPKHFKSSQPLSGREDKCLCDVNSCSWKSAMKTEMVVPKLPNRTVLEVKDKSSDVFVSNNFPKHMDNSFEGNTSKMENGMKDTVIGQILKRSNEKSAKKSVQLALTGENGELFKLDPATPEAADNNLCSKKRREEDLLADGLASLEIFEPESSDSKASKRRRVQKTTRKMKNSSAATVGPADSSTQNALVVNKPLKDDTILEHGTLAHQSDSVLRRTKRTRTINKNKEYVYNFKKLPPLSKNRTKSVKKAVKQLNYNGSVVLLHKNMSFMKNNNEPKLLKLLPRVL